MIKQREGFNSFCDTYFLEAHKVMDLQSALAQILKTKAVTTSAPRFLTPGTRIYGHFELQKEYRDWWPYSIIGCDELDAEVTAAKCGSKACFALEDVRLIPKNIIAHTLMEEELGVQKQTQELYS